MNKELDSSVSSSSEIKKTGLKASSLKRAKNEKNVFVGPKQRAIIL